MIDILRVILWLVLVFFASCDRSILKVVLQNLVKFTGKHLCLSLVFGKVAGLRKPSVYFQPTV